MSLGSTRPWRLDHSTIRRLSRRRLYNKKSYDTEVLSLFMVSPQGTILLNPDLICPYTDISRTARGNASFRAFRLTKTFLEVYKRNNFSTER